MKILEKILPRTHNIYLMGDTHEGTILKHKKGIKKFVERVNNDSVGYVIHHGDITEAITIDDKRYCSYTVDPETPTPLLQFRNAAEELKPIADKILVILDGNHDWKLANRFGNCIKEIVCPTLAGNKDPDEIYGTYSCKLIIKDKNGNLMYKHFATHGAKNISSTADDPIRQEANMKLQLKRRLHRKAGDCISMSMGHTHRLLVAEPTPLLYLTDNGKKPISKYTQAVQDAPYISPELRWYVNTGCFYRLYGEDGLSGYAERAGYDPTELGYAVMRVEGGVVKGIEEVPI